MTRIICTLMAALTLGGCTVDEGDPYPQRTYRAYRYYTMASSAILNCCVLAMDEALALDRYLAAPAEERPAIVERYLPRCTVEPAGEGEWLVVEGNSVRRYHTGGEALGRGEGWIVEGAVPREVAALTGKERYRIRLRADEEQGWHLRSEEFACHFGYPYELLRATADVRIERFGDGRWGYRVWGSCTLLFSSVAEPAEATLSLVCRAEELGYAVRIPFGYYVPVQGSLFVSSAAQGDVAPLDFSVRLSESESGDSIATLTCQGITEVYD